MNGVSDIHVGFRKKPRLAQGRDVLALSSKEREVLGYLAKGLSNKQIAEPMGVTSQVISFHLQNVFTKLGVSNRTSAVLMAERLGLIRVEGCLSPVAQAILALLQIKPDAIRELVSNGIDVWRLEE